MEKSKHRIGAVLAVALAGAAVGWAAWKRKKQAALPAGSEEELFSTEEHIVSELDKEEEHQDE